MNAISTAPYIDLFNDTFIDANTLANFNGGAATHDAANERVQVVAAAAARGVIVPVASTNIANQRHIVEVDVTLGAGPIRVYQRWAERLEDITTSGKHIVEYVSDGVAGAFGDRFVLTADGADTFFINSIRILGENPDRLERSNGDEDQLLASFGTALYRRNYATDNDISDLLTFGGNAISHSNGALVFAPTTNGQVVGFPYGNLDVDDVDFVDVLIDVEIPTAGHTFQMQPVWQNGPISIEIDESRIYAVRMHRIGNGPNAALNRFVINSTSDDGDGGLLRIKNIELKLAPPIVKNDPYSIIGQGAENRFVPQANNVNNLSRLGTVHGARTKVNTQNPALFGSDINALFVARYPGAGSGLFGSANAGELAGTGYDLTLGGWRQTGMSSRGVILAQSGSGFGYGVDILKSHGLGAGRGMVVPSPEMMRENVGPDTVIAGRELYFENGWCHRQSLPLSGIGTTVAPVPSDITIRLHGQDAYDARHPEWDASEAYPQPTDSTEGEVVQRNGFNYKAVQGSTGHEPGTDINTATGEAYFIGEETFAGDGVQPADPDPVWILLSKTPNTNEPIHTGEPTDSNVAGGHFFSVAGLPTGDALGGNVGWEIADGTNRGGNLKQNSVPALMAGPDRYADSDTPLTVRVVSDRNVGGDATAFEQKGITLSPPNAQGLQSLVVQGVAPPTGQPVVNIGTANDSNDGDTIRDAFDKINQALASLGVFAPA